MIKRLLKRQIAIITSVTLLLSGVSVPIHAGSEFEEGTDEEVDYNGEESYGYELEESEYLSDDENLNEGDDFFIEEEYYPDEDNSEYDEFYDDSEEYNDDTLTTDIVTTDSFEEIDNPENLDIEEETGQIDEIPDTFSAAEEAMSYGVETNNNSEIQLSFYSKDQYSTNENLTNRNAVYPDKCIADQKITLWGYYSKKSGLTDVDWNKVSWAVDDPAILKIGNFSWYEECQKIYNGADPVCLVFSLELFGLKPGKTTIRGIERSGIETSMTIFVSSSEHYSEGEADESQIIKMIPANNEQDVDTMENKSITLLFDQEVTPGNGLIHLYNFETHEELQNISVNDESHVVYEKNQIEVFMDLPDATLCSVVFDQGSIYIGGRAFIGLHKEGDWVFKTKNENIEANTIIYNNNGRHTINPGYGLDDCLIYSSLEYNPDLAYMLIALATSAYQGDVPFTPLHPSGGGFRGGFPDDPLAITESLKNLGFSADNIIEENYYTDGHDPHYDEDTTAFTIASKTTASGEQVVTIIVRGSYGGLSLLYSEWANDWKSNTNFKNYDRGLHEGFSLAADKIVERLDQFLSEKAINKYNAKYVVTGHSRGAAVANLVSKKLIDNGVQKTKVYDYNFACPDSGRDYDSEWNRDNKYSSIFNVNNVKDIIGVVPGAFFIQSLNIINYSTNFFDRLFNHSSNYEILFWGKYGTTYFFSEDWSSLTDTIFGDPSIEHQPTTYLRYLGDKPSNNYFKSWNEARTMLAANASGITALGKVMGIFCPVDTEIIDSNGNIVAEIINGEQYYYNDSFGNVAIITADDQCLIYLCGNDDYSVNMKGTNDGTLDILFADAIIPENEKNTITFESISLEKGKVINCTIRAGEAVEETALYVVDENGVPIKEISHDGTENSLFESGMCGDNVHWSLNSKGELIISGTGAVNNNSKWNSLKDQIKTIVLESGITSIGNETFYDFDKLTTVIISESIKTIGEYAFAWCNKLVDVKISNGLLSNCAEAFIHTPWFNSYINKELALQIYSRALRGKQGDFCLLYITDDDIPDLIYRDEPNSYTLYVNGAFMESVVVGDLGTTLYFAYYPYKNFYLICTDKMYPNYYTVGSENGLIGCYECLSRVSYGYYESYISENEGGRFFDTNFNKWIADRQITKNEFDIIKESRADGELEKECIFVKNSDQTIIKVILEKTPLAEAVVTGVSTKSYTGKAITQVPTIKIGSTTLKNNIDYTLSYKNNINAGTATMTIAGKGKYAGKITKKFTIKAVSVKNAIITGITSKVYTGRELTQSPVVKLGGKTLKLNTDYYLAYKNNINTGRATIAIKGKGNYTGVAVRYFAVKPKPSWIDKLTVPRTKQIKITWGKRTQISGYQIEISTNKTFAKPKQQKNVYDPKKLSMTVSVAKAKTTYYIRIRTFKKTKDKTYFSTWSAVKKIITK